jgi:glycosyltransferase involved in cell wall biosynthesis
MIDISVVVPIYFNVGSIKKTCDSLKEMFSTHFKDLTYEIILIDDGSQDLSYNEMLECKDVDKNVTTIKLTRNFGQVAAIYAGYQNSIGNCVLVISADQQDPVSLFIDLINSYLKKEAKIIVGERIGRDEDIYRRITSKVFYNLMKKLSFENMPKGGFDTILADREVINKLLELNEVNPFIQGQFLWTGYSIKFIKYFRQKREIGKSRWTLSKKTNYLLDGVMNYSYLPLRIFSILGITTFILGIIYAIVIIIDYFLGGSPFKGWAPIMIVILLFSGLQLVMLGLIGEYLWRNLEQSKKRPNFIIEKLDK